MALRMNELTPTFQALGLSLLLGLLVGLQREVADSDFAGIRSFALTALFGTLCSLLAQHFGGGVLVAGFGGVIALLLIGNLSKLRKPLEQLDFGVTTEVALLLIFAVGAYLPVGRWEVTIVVGGSVAVLLHLKPELHSVANRLGRADLKAIMQFVLVTFIILPVLPNQTYGPLQVFNPFQAWLMVTLIVGISLSGYLAYHFFGSQAGVLLSGLLGGAISSTATTLAYARRSRREPEMTRLAALAISLASAVVLVRVLLEVAIIAPMLLSVAAAPIALTLLLSLAPALWLWWRERQHPSAMPPQKNPTEIGAAVSLAVLYVIVLFVLAYTQVYLGVHALYPVAALSGLTDVDAITLSLSRLAATSHLAADNAWRLLLTAILANLVFKAGMVAALGGWRLFKVVALLLAPPLLGGGVVLWLWPY